MPLRQDKMRCCNLFLTIVMLAAANIVYAGKSTTEKQGDILQVLIPLTAYGTTFYIDDREGRYQFYKSFLTTVIITQTLKYTVNKPRPENNGYQSFPSGHTSAAFQGAAFIQKRYGWKYGLPAYAAASFVGWSRIEGESDKHDLTDVLAGAAIGTLSSYYFTTEYKNITVAPFVKSSAIGINLSMDW